MDMTKRTEQEIIQCVRLIINDTNKEYLCSDEQIKVLFSLALTILKIQRKITAHYLEDEANNIIITIIENIQDSDVKKIKTPCFW